MTTVVHVAIDEQNPWPGLGSFDEGSERFFNGRQSESAELRRLTLNAPLTVLFGASGLGKTSLVQAGLFPLLRKEHYLPVYIRLDLRDRTTPLIEQVKLALQAQIEARRIDAPPFHSDESLWHYLHRAGLELWSDQNRLLTPLFVFDQFEEVFTLGTENPAAIARLRIDLADLIENRMPADLAGTVERNEAASEGFSLNSQRYKVVLSFREDFLPAVESWKRELPSILRNHLRLLPMSGEQAFEAVHKTASYLVDEPTARQIIRFVAAAQDGTDSGEGPLENMTELTVEPALLSLVCSGLNEKRKAQGKATFDEELLAGSGQSIISDYYAKSVADLPERVQRFIENELITERGFRKPCDIDDARSVHGVTDQELRLLVDRRVLRIEPQRGTERVELTHDLLTRVVREHRDRERDREKERAKVRRQRRVRRRIYGLMVATTLIIVVLAYLVIIRSRSLRQSIAISLVMTAELLTRRDNVAVAQGLLLAAESMRRTPSLEAEEVLRSGLALLPTEISHSGGQGCVDAVIFSPDGRYVAAANDDGTLRVIEAATGKEIRHLKHEGKVNAIAFSPDSRYVAMASDDGTALVMKSDTGKEVSRIKHEGKVNAIAFSPDDRYVALASEDGTASTARVIEAATGKDVSRLKQEGKINAIAFSPDGRWLAVGGHSEDGTGFASVLSLRGAGPKFRTLQPRSVTAVAFSSDGGALTTSGQDYTTRLFRLDSGVEQWRFMNQATVNAIAFSKDGLHLATGSSDHTARVIEVATGKEIARLPNQATVLSVAFSPNGALVATGSADGTVRVVEASANKELLHVPSGKKFYQLGAKTFSAAAFSPDHHYVATADNAGLVRVTEVSTGNGVGTFQLGNADMYVLAFSPNGRQLATAGADETVRLVDLATDHEIWERKDIGKVYAVAFSHDGRYVIVGGLDGNVRLIDLHGGTDASEFPLETGEQIAVLAASPSGDRIAIASSKKGKNLVHVLSPTGRELFPALRNEDQINALIFSPKDGRYLAIAGAETVRVIETGTGKEVLRHSYPKQWIYSAAFSGDGQLVAIGREDGTVRVIDVRTGQELHGLAHGEPVYDLAFSKDNGRESLLVFAGETGYEDLLRRPDLIDEACLRLAPTLTEEQASYYKKTEDVDYSKTCPVNQRSAAATSKR